MAICHVLVVAVFVLAGCGAAEHTADDSTSTSQSETASPAPASRRLIDQTESGPREDVPSAITDITAPGLPDPLIDPTELASGGPPPDGIPSIDEPLFLDAADVDFLADDEPVLALEIDGDARAYPIQVMIWHEIVNDTVGGIPVAITYCPLCNTAIALDRRADDRILDFGVSGLLYQSALVMYDRQTESLWSHFTGEAVAGVLTGTELDRFPVATVGWAEWRDAHPDGIVLSRDTGHDRTYGTNPYPGYDSIDNPPFLFTGEVDGRLAPKERVVGVGRDTDPTAIRLDPLLDEGAIHFELGGKPMVVLATRGTASALFAYEVADGPDVGSTGVFVASHDGQDLTFRRSGGSFVDEQTGTRWDIFGSAVSGPLSGERLEQIDHVDTFWFAWAAFAPETTVLP